jgi:formylglycine-generating enzyme required for sulfatase activity
VLGLNALIEKSDEAWIGAMFRLPTETEWEYACRADSVTPIYTGTLIALGANNSPDLDPIAWYGGNCGVDYAGGWDSTKWIAKQYPHTAAGTHAVGQKMPNPWGLYDMIGNVWEWCADWYGPYTKMDVTDPLGPATGSNRVARGASWGNAVAACRAGIRNPLPPEARHNRVGFRIVASE